MANIANAGNGGSLEKCRRRWDLADAEFLKYKFMNAFDRAMNHLDKAYSFSDNEHTYVSRKVRAACFPLHFLALKTHLDLSPHALMARPASRTSYHLAASVFWSQLRRTASGQVCAARP